MNADTKHEAISSYPRSSALSAVIFNAGVKSFGAGKILTVAVQRDLRASPASAAWLGLDSECPHR